MLAIVYTHRMAKVMISMPQDLLSRVDAAAAERSSSRSELIREALRRYLSEASASDRREALLRLRRVLSGGTWIAEDLVRAERER